MQSSVGSYVHVAGGGHELGAEDDAKAGHAGDHVEGVVVAKPGLDGLVEIDNLLVEAHHLLRQCVDRLGGQLLSGRQAGLLPLGGLDSDFGEPVGARNVTVA